MTPRRARRARRPPRVALRPAARGELDVLVRRRQQPSAAERERLEALRRLTAMLGAHLLVEEGDDASRSSRASPASAGRPTSCSARRRRGSAASRAARDADPAGAPGRRRPDRRQPRPLVTSTSSPRRRAVRGDQRAANRRASSAPARAVVAYSAMASRPRVENGALRRRRGRRRRSSLGSAPSAHGGREGADRHRGQAGGVVQDAGRGTGQQPRGQDRAEAALGDPRPPVGRARAEQAG